MQYKEVRTTLEMLPVRPGKRAAVAGLDFNASAEMLAAGGAGPTIQLHNYAAVLAGGTKCASDQVSIHAHVASGRCPAQLISSEAEQAPRSGTSTAMQVAVIWLPFNVR